MVILKTRKEILETKRIISSELAKIQKAFYDEDALRLCEDDGEQQLYLEQFDCLDKEAFEYDTYNKIIGVDHSNIETFTAKLASKLIELFKTIHVSDLIIISHLKLDFFGNRENSFKPLADSYNKLEKIVGQNSYKEAFIADLNQLSDFIEILFWASRCDPGIAEYIFLFDKEERIMISVCKYGNVHLTEFESGQLTNEILTALGWKIIDGQESDNFTINGAIEGRQYKT